ncbi:MAG: nitroreductase family deazaflavin-dependent oxidoreductase [Chloroflexi bacterium]|nr:nitroreductase family deazaflavin-dependent oxidoreductase [Chloroflexota bacterium]
MFSRVHALVYRWTGGLVGSRLPLTKLEVLLLTTTGRRSGKQRTTPLVYFRQGESLIVVASNRGAGRYPAWYWNLQFQPQARVQIRRTRQTVNAKDARAEERRFLWPLLKAKTPLLELYQARTKRELSVVILRPMEKA